MSKYQYALKTFVLCICNDIDTHKYSNVIAQVTVPERALDRDVGYIRTEFNLNKDKSRNMETLKGRLFFRTFAGNL